jgi:putative nucleotidyltransferase with HDIG domain
MLVHILTDNLKTIDPTRSILEPQFKVNWTLLEDDDVDVKQPDAIVIAADLHDAQKIEVLKSRLVSFGHSKKRVFLLPMRNHRSIAQAYALGATGVLPYPVDKKILTAELIDQKEISSSNPLQASAHTGALVLKSMFSAAMGGQVVDVKGVELSASQIVDSIATDGLSNWLNVVRKYHEGTYQHCLLVAGLATDFGLSLGMARGDVDRLYTVAMFHDIGKSRIPLKILDKPGRLDGGERRIIETHPLAGFDILSKNPEISSEILGAVQHHHEYLDGSGYPHGLMERNIPDIVRMLTIADVFAALIERRSYKEPMPRECAYEVLCGMVGKLELSLVKAFKNVGLHR